MTVTIARSRPRIVVTGRGVMSAIGGSVAEFDANLISGTGGIRCYDDLVPGQTAHVGLVERFAPPAGLDAAAPGGCDRTAELAAAAAAQALAEAGLWDGTRLGIPGEQIALLLGTSHGGRSQIDRFVTGGADAADPILAHGVMEHGAHYHQTAVLAALFGVHGPVLTLSTACSSSGTAIAHGMDLLCGGQARFVLAGGADAFSLLTFAGFRALGAVADEACGPFGCRTGISLGEGAAFVLLELLDDAVARGAAPLCELFGSATTWDAHHLTAPEPSGDGMRRAIETALAASGLPPGAVDYINAHGTGTRANDIAETLAIKRVFNGASPPVSATKSFTGHTLGASSAAGLLAGIAGMRAQTLPPTLNFGAGRPGCDLDYVPDTARPAPIGTFLALSAAFGGCNCAIVAGDVRAEPPHAHAAIPDAVVITGLGVMSPLGCDPEAAFAAACADPAGWDPDAATIAVRGFDPKLHLPRGRSARMNAITQFAVASAEQALTQAGWTPAKRQPTAIGLMVGLSRGAAGNFQACMESVGGGAWHKASPSAFPHLVMSSVGGQASVAIGLRGPASTLVGEGEVGIALLGHAAALLRQRPDLDALVVVAADELTPLFLQMQEAAFGRFALPLAEGAVTLVLERRGAAQARGATLLAELTGWAQSFDAPGGLLAADPDGLRLEQAMRTALERGGATPAGVELALTPSHGDARTDAKAATALRRLFGNAIPAVGAVPRHAGWGEASSGLLAVALAVLSLAHGRAPGSAEAGPFNTALVAGSSRHGNNAAVLLRPMPKAA